jgi:pyruvate ferredoxin oxidoreductase gamma subunit/2-oxoisovalerate ferredoxin oxidoreductase gamma subunit
MKEIRFHGRGGQGVVIASKLLASASALENHYVQAFPLFGGERRGAPVKAFTRLSPDRILVRSNVYTPDCIVVLDASLIDVEDITIGLKPSGQVLINSPKEPMHFASLSSFQVGSVDASKIAIAHQIGSKNSPIVNTAILGAFARMTGLVSLKSILNSLDQYVPDKILSQNRDAVAEAYEKVCL